MCRGNPRTLGTRANFASTPLAGGSQPATESAAGQHGGDHALFGVHRRGGSTVRRRDNECVARAVCDLRVSSTFVTAAPGRVVCGEPVTRAGRRIDRKLPGGVLVFFLFFRYYVKGAAFRFARPRFLAPRTTHPSMTLGPSASFPPFEAPGSASMDPSGTYSGAASTLAAGSVSSNHRQYR